MSQLTASRFLVSSPADLSLQMNTLKIQNT